MSKNILYIGNHLVSSTKYVTTLETLSQLLINEGYRVSIASNKRNKMARLLDMCFSVLKHRNKTDYLLIDTYSTTNFYYAFIVSQLARMCKIAYIPILHGGNLPYRLQKSKLLSKLIFSNSYINVSPSNYLKDAFEKQGYPTKLIPNPIEIEKYPFKTRSQLAPKLLYVRAFADIYNPTLAINVLHEVQKKYPKANLCMIGADKDGSLQQVKKLIEKYNLQASVEITGFLSKKEWHKKSEEFDIFINTTNVDNTPVSVIEAMALGLPVVSTNVGGIPYLIKNLDNGILVEKDNVNEMTNAIFNLVENYHEELILKARKTAVSFAWDNIKHLWINLLK